MQDIIFENVCKTYEKNTVIDNLNLRVKKGERLILLGPSGCGKSTILRMIAGLEKISDGKLYMGDRCVNDVDCGDRNIAMVFQNYALFPHMTVKDNILYGLKVHKVPQKEMEQRLKQVLEMLDLAGYEIRKPKELSGGQRQRVALARAVVKKADYFLLDEPLSNLDAQLRLRARKELVKIHEVYGQTMIYVTHDQIEAMTVGERVALLNKGKIQMIDTPANVYHKPANVFTAKFIGSPSMNVVEIHIEDQCLWIGKESMPIPDIWKSCLPPGQKIYFGVRPEHILLTQEETEAGWSGIVKYVEDYGNRYGIYLDVAGTEFIVVSETEVPEKGSRMKLVIKPEKMHFFDWDTEQSIGYPWEGNAAYCDEPPLEMLMQ